MKLVLLGAVGVAGYFVLRGTVKWIALGAVGYLVMRSVNPAPAATLVVRPEA